MAFCIAVGCAAHPIVPGYNLLAGRATNDAQRAEAGLLLMAELNCTACHAAPDAWGEQLSPVPKRSLASVRARLDTHELWNFVSDPTAYKPGTTMPGLFGTNSAAMENMAKYLSTLGGRNPAMPAGDPVRGKSLYHSVGCVACHAPSDGRSSPGDASVPITLAKKYDVNALADFLQNPLHQRPGGRMPDLRLTAQEAADIASWLRPESTELFLDGDSGYRLGERIEQGRQQFAAMRCNACHDTGEKADAVGSLPLAKLAADRGCLSTNRVTGVPHFAFSEDQRSAIHEALRAVQTGPSALRGAGQRVAWQMARLNCYACHARDGIGGPNEGRAEYFGVNEAGGESLGEMAMIPPKLDRVGRKLTHGWFEKVLWGEGGGVRPTMNTRMPDFGRAQTEPLIAWLEEADRLETPVAMDTSGLLRHQRAETGRLLLGVGGLACVSCHGLKDRKSLGPPVMALTHTVGRLQPEYFKELLLNPQATQPGTVMPPLFTGRKNASNEIESIWTYLKELGAHPLPEGLASPGDYELKPKDRPIVFRSFIEGAGTHAIGVGFPQGLNAAFDAKSCRWTLIWKGRFLDAFSNFQDRPMKPIQPLGTDVKMLPGETAAREFLGYRLDKTGVPTMLYRENGAEIEDTLRPAADGKSFERFVRANKLETKETLSW